MIEVIAGIAIFYIGMFVGFFLRKWVVDKRDYDGVINVTKTDDKMTYSLELLEDPEELEFRDEVIFRIKTSSDKSLDRK